MAFDPTDYYIYYKSGLTQVIEDVTAWTRYPADPTLADTDPLTQAYMFAHSTYRDDGYFVPGITPAATRDDGTDSTTGTNAQRVPDPMMHTPPRFLLSLESCYVFTTNSGATYEIKCSEVRGMGTQPPV